MLVVRLFEHSGINIPYGVVFDSALRLDIRNAVSGGRQYDLKDRAVVREFQLIAPHAF